MLGDGEHPISFAFEPEVRGDHVHVRVRAGLRGMRALSGELVFRPEEWASLRVALSVANDDAARLALYRSSVPPDIASDPVGVNADWFTRFLLSDRGRVVHVDPVPFDLEPL